MRLYRSTWVSGVLATAFVIVSFGTFLIPNAEGATGGPDSLCVYRWTDTNPPPPTTSFSWVDIQSTGTLIGAWTNSDDGYAGPFPLGFTFDFYGNAYTDVFVGTNGYVSFGMGSGFIPFGVIPDVNPPDNFAMPYGSDLLPGSAISPAGVYYQQLAAPNRFVVAYHDVPYFGMPGTVTFEVVLYQTGELLFQYLSLTGFANLVGIEDSTGTVGLDYGTSLSNGLAILFETASISGPVAVSVTPCSQSVQGIPGTSLPATFTVTNRGTTGADTFDVAYASPSGWTGAWFQSDAVTPLPDTNGNAIPDTGSLAPSGGAANVVLRLDVPVTFSSPELVTVTATSTADTGVSATADLLVTAGPILFSSFAASSPAIDGAMSPGEWTDATSVDLGAIPGNGVPGYLLVKNDMTTLYIAYDGTGDTTADPFDVASFAFDTGNDDVATDLDEDQFIQGGWVPNDQAHYVWRTGGGGWFAEDSPFDPLLPDHAGLAGAWGFGPSDLSATAHRTYEFAVPLVLLGALPGDVLGFFGGSQPAPGLYDDFTGGWSLWPLWNPGPLPLDQYGTLVLGAQLLDHDVIVRNLQAPAFLEPGEAGWVNATVQNAGGNSETNVVVDLTIDGVTADQRTIASLPSGISGYIAFPWTPSTVGNVTVCIEVQPVPNENDTGNNAQCGVVTVRVVIGRVLFDQIHFTDPIGLYSAWVDELWRLGFPVDPLVAGPITSATFTRYDVFVVPQAQFPFSGSELAAVQAFVAEGGGLLVIGDDVPQIFDALTFFASIAWTGGGSSGITSDITAHEVTMGVATLDLLDPIAEMTPLGSALSLVRDPFGGHALVVSESPGRVAGFADETSLMDFGIGGGDNFVLAMNLIRWLVGPDTTPPAVLIATPSVGDVSGTADVTVTWTAQDNRAVTGFEVVLDDGAPVILGPTETQRTFSGLSEGGHTANVTAFDRRGNSAVDSVDFLVDLTPPTIAISAPAANALLRTSTVQITWAASDAISGTERFELVLDGWARATVAGTATGFTLAGLMDGAHTVTVTVFDRAGHTDTASVTFTVDTAAPPLTITSPTTTLTRNPSVTIAGTTEAGAVVTVEGTPVSVDGSGLFSRTVTLSEGNHALRVIATDAAGNANSMIIAVTVDTTAPALAITSPTNGARTNDATVIVSGTTEAGAQLVVNDVVVTVGADGRFSFVLGLSEGENVITATSTDPAENVATSTITVTYVDPAPGLEQQAGALGLQLLALLAVIGVFVLLTALFYLKWRKLKQQKGAPPPPPPETEGSGPPAP